MKSGEASRKYMIINLTGNIIFQMNTPFLIQRTIEEKQAINSNWSEFIRDKSLDDYYNGDIFLVTNVRNDGNNYIFNIGKTKFSDLIYAKQTNNIKIRSLFVASYIRTADNFFCIIRNKCDRINTIGGMADNLDFDNEQFFPQNCLCRELKEELGFDLIHDSDFCDIIAKYIKIPTDNEDKVALYPIGILYEIRTTLFISKLLEKFKENKKYTDGEISEILFYNKDNYKQIEQCENKESYIFELFTHIVNDDSLNLSKNKNGSDIMVCFD